MAEQTPQISLPEVLVTPREDNSMYLTQGQPAVGTPGLSFTMQERQTVARASGHEWFDVNKYLSEKRGEALSAGHSNDDVDAFLGYPSPSEMLNQTSTRALLSQSQNPEWADTLQTVPADKDKPIPPEAKAAVVNPESRQDYADALSAGQARGPMDWSRALTDHMVRDDQPETKQAAERLSGEVAKDLPSQEQALDTAMALNLAAGKGFTAAEIAVTKQNVLNQWAKTGMALGTIYEKSKRDPNLLTQMTEPNRIPQEQPEARVHYPQSQEEFEKGITPELLKQGRDAITHVALPIGPGFASQVIAGGVAETFGSGSVLKSLERVGIDTAAMYVGGVASGWVLRQGGRLLGYLWSKRPTFDPMKAPGAAEKAVNPIEVVEPRLGAVKLTEPVEATTSFGNKFYEQKVLDAEGQEIGYVGYRKIEGTDKATIDMVSLSHVRLDENGKAVFDKLTLAQVRSIARQFFLHNPEINSIEGLRISGARKAAGKLSKGSITRESVMPAIDKETGKLTGLTPQEDAAAALHIEMSRQMYGGFWPKDIAAGLSRLIFGGTAADQAYVAETNQIARRLSRYYQAQTGREKNAYAMTLEPMRKALTQHMDEYEQWLKGARRGPQPVVAKLIEFLDGKRNISTLTGDLRDTATAMQGVIKRLQADVTSLSRVRGGKAAYDRFFRGYFQHLWQEPKQVVETAFGGIPGAKPFPTFSDGIARGLTPRFADPIEGLLNYAASMAKYNNDFRLIDEMRKAGLVKWSQVAPFDGWRNMNGTIAHRFSKMKNEMLYAPPGVARIWNAYIGEGIHSWSNLGPLKPGALYDKVQRVANTLLMVRLAWFGFHVTDIAAESQVAGISQALGDFGRGEIAAGLKDLGMSASLLPGGVHFARRGQEMQDAWRDLDNKNPLAQIIFGAGLRAEGRSTRYQGGQALDIERMASGPTFGQLLGRGTFWKTMKQEAKQGVPGLSVAVNTLERAVDTFNSPVFDKVIPKIKIGVVADEVEGWMRSHPGAAMHEIQDAAMRIVDRVDDTFGELNQDNLFWKRSTKQILNLMTVSIGWEYGSLRAFGRGTSAILNGEWSDPYARWMTAFLGHTMLKNAIYQKLKTGNSPLDTNTPAQDVMTPQTGGTFTYKGVTTPERAQLPGYEKETNSAYRITNEWANVGQLLRNTAGYGYGKLKFPFNQLRYTLTDTAPSGDHPFNMTDENRKPITSFMHMELPKGLASYLNYIGKDEIMPLTLQTLMQRYKGTNISTTERLFGIRPASTFFQQPEAVMHRLNRAEHLNDKYQGRRDSQERERQE